MGWVLALMQTAVQWGTMASWKVCCIPACVPALCPGRLPLPERRSGFLWVALFPICKRSSEENPYYLSVNQFIQTTFTKPTKALYSPYVFPHFINTCFSYQNPACPITPGSSPLFSISVYDFIPPASQCTESPIYSSYCTWSIGILDLQELKITEFKFTFWRRKEWSRKMKLHSNCSWIFTSQRERTGKYIFFLAFALYCVL